jgi:hypothetical protein
MNLSGSQRFSPLLTRLAMGGVFLVFGISATLGWNDILVRDLGIVWSCPSSCCTARTSGAGMRDYSGSRACYSGK